MFRQSTNQNYYAVLGQWVMSLDGINGRSIQTLLRGENDSKQSDEFQAMFKDLRYKFFRNPIRRPCKSHKCNNWAKRNKGPICKNISNPGVIKVLSVITLGPDSNGWKDKVTIPMFGNIRSAFQCLEEKGHNANVTIRSKFQYLEE